MCGIRKELSVSLRVCVLAENSVNKANLLAEHGLSLHVEYNGIKIIFDTGQSSVYVHNAAQMGLNLSNTDYIVLSHGHYDHVGGLTHFPQKKTYPTVVAHSQVFFKHMRRDPLDKKDRDIGMTCDLSEHKHIQKHLIYNREKLRLAKNVYVLTNVTYTTDSEEKSSQFFIKQNGQWNQDLGTNEQILTILMDKGIVVFLGCAHAGVINCVEHVKRCFPNRKLYALVGGMHMKNAGDLQIEHTTCFLYNETLHRIFPMHCTGMNAFCAFKDRLKDRCIIKSVGDVFTL